jgi:hypothetical protein
MDENLPNTPNAADDSDKSSDNDGEISSSSDISESKSSGRELYWKRLKK